MKHLYQSLELWITAIVILTFTSVKGQIEIQPGPAVTPEDMVENIVGDGIQYDNVTLQGANVARGIFSNGQTTNLGIASGIFLTSGAGYNIPGPNVACGSTGANGMPGHPSLNAITTSTTYDACVLEFDFIPESDTLRFKYVFGSEEYNEWVNTAFNDVFGYFVTGPDPMGGMYSDKNVAIVPGTTNTSVTINNVNNGNKSCGTVPTGPCEYCAYYSDNTGGLTLEYDGLTTVLTAYLLVVPCEMYHIKMGVADAGDGIYDSGVFIEENSFESPKIEVQSDPFPQGVSDNMIEGCVEADIIFELPDPSYAPITVCFEIEGTASNGIDYEFIENCVTFEEGEDSVAIHVVPLKDDQIEGEETIIFIIENTLGCIVRYDTVEFIIMDYIDMVTVTSPNTVMCQGQSIDLWVQTFNGIPTYSYEWEGFSVDNDTLTVSPDTTTMYYVSVMDLCQDTVTDSIQVTVFPNPDVDLGEDTTVMCMGDTLALNAGGGYLGYFWNTGAADSIINVYNGGLYYVTVVGPGGCTQSDTVLITETVVTVELGEDQSICVGESYTFDAGSGFDTYSWQDGSSGQTFTADETGTYKVEVCIGSCCKEDSVFLFVDDPSVGFTLGNDTTICTGDQLVLKPKQGFYEQYTWSTGDTTPSIIVSQPGTYSLHVLSGCGEADDQITVGLWPYPNPGLGPDLQLCYGEVATLEANFGFIAYTWQDNSSLPFYTVTESGLYYVDVTDVHGCNGTDTVFAEIGDIVQLPDDSLTLCEGETLNLQANSGFDFYSWSNGQSGVNNITVDQGGWYKVSVNYFFGCPSADSTYVDAYPVPDALISGQDMLCEGDTIWLNAPQGAYQYYWNNQLTNSSQYMVTSGGNVTLKMANVCGEDTDTKTVQLNPLPNPDLGADIILFPGEAVTLDAGNYQSFIWNNDPALTQQMLTVAYEDIEKQDSIWVEVFDGYCKNSDDIIIEVFAVEVPIVITPNGDGFNDEFRPDEKGFSGINKHNIMVFNRWGEKVWESSDFMSGWDGKSNGKLVDDGTYFWVLEVYYGNDNVKKAYKGSLTVLGAGS
ncbi:MAG TPA: choice-of-anchor L domain-containing protein [Bacteroidales bacterium]|nr:choice-of-anchor L domain-containing protein [Bacteroidales bacterium]